MPYGMLVICDFKLGWSAKAWKLKHRKSQFMKEKLHLHWTKDDEYLPPPSLGKLAELAPALIVTPPEGLEVGYVPIVTRQE